MDRYGIQYRSHAVARTENIARFQTTLDENNGQLGTELRENETTLFENRPDVVRFCLFGEILRAVQLGALPRAEAYAPFRSPYF